MTKARVVIATPSMIDQSRLEKTLGQTGKFDLVALTSDLSATYSKVEELLPDIIIIAEGFARQDEYQCMVSLFRAVETRAVSIIGSHTSDPGNLAQPQVGDFVHSRMSAVQSCARRPACGLCAKRASAHRTLERRVSA